MRASFARHASELLRSSSPALFPMCSSPLSLLPRFGPRPSAAVNLCLVHLPDDRSSAPPAASPLAAFLSSTHVLLTKRPASMREHAGQISLPGGKREPPDGRAPPLPNLPPEHASHAECALRETLEELQAEGGAGFPLDFRDEATVLGLAAPLPGLSRLAVHPLVTLHAPPGLSRAALLELLSASADRGEVAAVGALSLRDLLSDLDRDLPVSAHETRPPPPAAGPRERAKRALLGALGRFLSTPAFRSELGEVWGITGFVLRGFGRNVLRPWVEEVERGGGVTGAGGGGG